MLIIDITIVPTTSKVNRLESIYLIGLHIPILSLWEEQINEITLFKVYHKVWSMSGPWE